MFLFGDCATHMHIINQAHFPLRPFKTCNFFWKYSEQMWSRKVSVKNRIWIRWWKLFAEKILVKVLPAKIRNLHLILYNFLLPQSVQVFALKMDGRICLSCFTLLFNFTNSNFAIGFWYTTIPKHQSVSCSTLCIIPSHCIVFSSVSTFGRSTISIRLRVVQVCG